MLRCVCNCVIKCYDVEVDVEVEDDAEGEAAEKCTFLGWDDVECTCKCKDGGD